MAEGGSHGLGFRLDIKQILLEAQHRWLRPAEICEILRNYEKFHISPEAPNKPVSGSVFLFDRKVLRYFRKDGHNWRKKKDGKTTKEAHEKLKVESVDMLHCYYAHGEGNENFQRRSYWLLEPERMHIVFVHYLEVKGNKTNTSYAINSDRVASDSENDGSLSSSFCGTSPISNLSPVYEDAESESIQQVSSQFNSYPESPLTDDGHSAQSSSYNQFLSPGNENISVPNYASILTGRMSEDFVGSSPITGFQSKADLYLGNPGTGDDEYRGHISFPVQSDWQVMGNLLEEKLAPSGQEYFERNAQAGNKNLQMHFPDTEPGNGIDQNFENSVTMIGNESYPFLVKKPLIGLQTEENLKKVDSFSRWIAKELEDADALGVHSSNGISWSTMGGEGSAMSDHLQIEGHILSPFISQDQLFSITDFFPNWAYSNAKTKVLVTGTFLKSRQEVYQCRWSIMFGEIEVPAVVLADGILCCCSPLQNPGVVPFYVTCSNRLACSELREFEYRPNRHIRSVDINGDRETTMHLYQRFEMILCLDSVGSRVNSAGKYFEKQKVINKIISLMEEENYQEARLAPRSDKPHLVIGELLLEKQLKENFYSWLLDKVTGDDKGPMITDEWGQSVLHLAAALGFKWAIMPMIASGVSIDFRDVNGWTALHWAAFYGREDTVVSLVAMGANHLVSTDPTAEYPLGRTPADLASSSGHKGISGFLAENYLTSLLSVLALKDEGVTDASGLKQTQVSERLPVPSTEEDVPDTLLLKDSLAAVCNARQAAARIHQFFRIQSFHRKQIEQSADYLLTPEEQAIALVTGKASRSGHTDGMANAAALQIQKKYRGWRKRKEFLFIREKVVKIQAHVRGHQVRKKYKPFLWSVGILEKVILRWRRKGSGLRGFRSNGIGGSMDTEAPPEQEDDYDFLKEGRKQTEERMQKALSRVQSMAQNPEARAQYRRLLTAVERLRVTKEEASDGDGMIPEQVEGLYSDEDLLDVASLLDDDDAFMSLAFQ